MPNARRDPVFALLFAACVGGCALYDGGIRPDEGPEPHRQAVATVLMGIDAGQKVRLHLANGTTVSGALSEWNFADVTLSRVGFEGVRRTTYDFGSIVAAEAIETDPTSENIRF